LLPACGGGGGRPRLLAASRGGGRPRLLAASRGGGTVDCGSQRQLAARGQQASSQEASSQQVCSLQTEPRKAASSKTPNLDTGLVFGEIFFWA